MSKLTRPASPGSAEPLTAASWVTRDVRFVLMTQMVFAFGWSLYLLTPKFLATQLHAGPEIIGRIGAVGGATGLLTVPFTGLAIDRLGRRVFFQLGAAVLLMLSLGFMHVERIGPLMYLLQGCISAAFVLAYNASAALLADYAPPERLGQAIGWAGSANVAMNAVSTMIAEPLATHYGWHTVFGLGAAAAGAALCCSLWLREAANRPNAKNMAAATGARAKSAAPPALVPILLAALLMGCVFVAMFGFIQPYAISVGATEVRNFFLGYTVSAVAGRLWLGGLGDKRGRRLVSMWMLAGYAISTLIVRDLQPNLLVVYGLVFGAAHGILYPTMNALTLEALPPMRRGLGIVLYNGAFNVGSSAGSLGWGLIARHHGYPMVYTVAAVTALCAAWVLYLARGTSTVISHHAVPAPPQPDAHEDSLLPPVP